MKLIFTIMKVLKETKRYIPKIKHNLFLKKKELYHSILPPAEEKNILFIVGCQRSGTTMMQGIFEKDLSAKVYGEFSKLSCHDQNKIRLNPLDQVEREIKKDTPPLVVLKPLVETQNLKELFDYFPSSKAVWMFRHFKDVAASNLKNFGESNGIKDLKPIFEGDPNNWRSEGTSKHVREVVQKYFSEDMNELDAAALFWYARNSLFFDLNLENDSRVFMCRYEDLVHKPIETMKEIYAFTDSSYPEEEEITSNVKTSSVGKGKDVNLHHEIEALCNQMLKRLEEAYLAREEKRGMAVPATVS
jgi:hypothetical protein